MAESNAQVVHFQQSQAAFLCGLAERLLALESEIGNLGQTGRFDDAKERLRRRIEAMASTAELLELDALGAAFTSAEASLACAQSSVAAELTDALETLRLVPSLLPPTVEAPEVARELISGCEPEVLSAAPTKAVPVAEPPTADPLPPTVKEGVTRSATAVAQRRGSPQPPSLGDLDGARVLVVDDDPAVTDMFVAALSARGALTLTSHDGREALRIAERAHPDLILSDLSMPRLDGFGLTQVLKRDIVLSSVPVILIAWRSQELERARELGAGADGYMLKDADQEAILAQCASALRGRAGLIRRLCTEEVTTGRVDGLTPHQLLELVSRYSPDATVTFRDSSFEYDLQVSGGLFSAPCRYDTAGRDVAQATAISGLLGVRDGRFCVERCSEAPSSELFTLETLFGAEVHRIRHVMWSLQGANLQGVERLELEALAAAAYREDAPSTARRIVDKIEAGIRPAALLTSTSASLLESVLLDLAGRGAVVGLWGNGDHDLMASAPVHSAPFDVDIRTPSELVPQVTSTPLEEAPRHDDRLVHPEPFTRATSPLEAPEPTCPADDEAPTRPILVTDAPTHTTRNAPTTLASEGATATELAPESGLPQKAEPTKRAEPETNPPQGDTQSAPTRTGKLTTGVASLESSTPADRELSTWVLDQLSLTPGPLPTEGKPPAESRPRSSAGGGPRRRRHAKPASEETASATAVSSQLDDELSGEVSLDGEDFPEDSGGRQNSPKKRRSSRKRAGAGAVSGLRQLLERANRQGRNGAKKQLDRLRQVVARHEDPNTLDDDFATELQVPIRANDGDADEENSGRELNDDSEAAEATSVDDLGHDFPEVEESRPIHRTRRRSKLLARAAAAGVPALVAAATAGGAYWVTRGVASKVELTAPTGRADDLELAAVPEPTAAANVTQLAPPTTGAQRRTDPAFQLQSISMAMPDGLRVREDKGLLEINTNDTQKIYVGNVFVGRGPVRRVPLSPGSHAVTVRQGSQEATFQVSVEQGKRTRLQPVAQLAR